MASTSAPPRAVVLKGPSTNSKSYFIALPDTLDELIEKAKGLFPLPPDKTPVITLGNDERAILLQETMPFVRDREPLVFRWVAATPKRQLGNRVRWDEPSSVQFNANAPSSSISTPAKPFLAQIGRTSSLDLYSPASKGQPSSRSPHPTPNKSGQAQTRDPNVHFGDGLTARQAHVKRVLQEQKDKEARRQQRLAESQSAADQMDVEEPNFFVSETTASIDSAVELPEADLGQTENASGAASNTVELPTVTTEALLISPPRKRHPENTPLDTPPSSGSRSSSPYRSQDRKRTASEMKRAQQCESEEQTSSPIQSPTRDLSSARQKAALGISDITNALTAGSELKRVTELDSTVKESLPPLEVADALRQLESRDDAEKSSSGHQEEPALTAEPSASASSEAPLEEAAVEPFAPKSATSVQLAVAVDPATTINVPDAGVEKTYRYIDNLALQLLSHSSNTAFKEPVAPDVIESLAALVPRFVDLHTIRRSIEAKAYGSAHIDDSVKASKAVMLDFENDLATMYANARRIHGTKSAQAQCADTLERFSASFIDEWKRSIDKKPSREDGPGGKGEQRKGEQDELKTAIMRQLTPTKRGEKRPVQLGAFPFSFGNPSRMLFPGGSVTPNPSRKADNQAGWTSARPATQAKKLATLEHPGLIKRNLSHDGQMSLPFSSTKKSRLSDVEKRNSLPDGPFRDIFAQHRAKPPTTSSEAESLAAFERALRGPRSAPVEMEQPLDEASASTQGDAQAASPASEEAHTIEFISEPTTQSRHVEAQQSGTNEDATARIEEAESTPPLAATAEVTMEVEPAAEPSLPAEAATRPPQTTKEKVDEVVDAVILRAERESSQESTQSSAGSTASSGAKKGKKRGRPSRAELAVRLASQALAETEMPQTPSARRQSRTSGRLSSGSSSPTKAAVGTSEQSNQGTPETETRKSKRQRTSSITSSIATPAQPKSTPATRKGRKSASSTPTPTSEKRVTHTTIDITDDSDDDAPLRVTRPGDAEAKKGKVSEVAAAQEEEEEEVRLMFAGPSSGAAAKPAPTANKTGTKKGSGGGPKASKASRKRKASAVGAGDMDEAEGVEEDVQVVTVSVPIEQPQSLPARQTRSTRRGGRK